MNKGTIKLRSFSILEVGPEGVEVDLKPFALGNFNLLIGDNAQGKTRIFNTLKFVKGLFTGKSRPISTRFTANFEFGLRQEKRKNPEILRYEIAITPGDGGNMFSEIVEKSGKRLLSTKDKTLFNETKRQQIKNFFIPKNVPALLSVDEKDFFTMSMLRQFFQRMLFLDAGKTKQLHFDPGALQLNDLGTNVASVLENWKTKYPEIFQETIRDLRKCFSLIRSIAFIKAKTEAPIPANILAFEEQGVEKKIDQLNWSDGIYRVLCLLCLPKTVFNLTGKLDAPSLIAVDEIENGLDFKTLKFIIQYFLDYSDESQILLSTHSPLVCDFVHPNEWRVVKRNGTTVEVKHPPEVEKQLDEQLELFKNRHWEFYSKHISNSRLYRVK